MSNFQISPSIHEFLTKQTKHEAFSTLMGSPPAATSNSNALASGVEVNGLYRNTSDDGAQTTTAHACADNYTLLAQNPGASAAYSLRRLSSNTTNVLRARRGSDNVELDVQFDSNDEVSLQSPIGTRQDAFILQGATGVMAQYNNRIFEKRGATWNTTGPGYIYHVVGGGGVYFAYNGSHWYVWTGWPEYVNLAKSVDTLFENANEPWLADWNRVGYLDILNNATFDRPFYGKTLGEFTGYENLDLSRGLPSNGSSNYDQMLINGNRDFDFSFDTSHGLNSKYMYLQSTALGRGTYRLTGSIKVTYDKGGASMDIWLYSGFGLQYPLFDYTNGAEGTTYTFTEDAPLVWTSTMPEGSVQGLHIYNHGINNNNIGIESAVVECRDISIERLNTDASVVTWYDQSSGPIMNYNLYDARPISETTQDFFQINKTDDRNFQIVSDLVNDSINEAEFIPLVAPPELVSGRQRMTFDLTVNDGDISNFMFRLSYRDDQSNLQPIAGFNKFEFDLYDDGVPMNPQIYFAIHSSSSYDITISNLEIYSGVEGDVALNNNDATQTTTAWQPKIVEAGEVVLKKGKVAIKSTSSNELRFSVDSLSADGQQSVFSILENDITSQGNFSAAFRLLSATNALGTGRDRRPYWYISPGNGNLNFSVDSNGDYNTVDRDRRLYSHIMNADAGGTSTVYQDGIDVYTHSITLDANAAFSQGRLLGVNSNAVGALYMSEVIYYPSDQSDNRLAIESNITNHYSPLPEIPLFSD
jgi:hypothetical protein